MHAKSRIRLPSLNCEKVIIRARRQTGAPPLPSPHPLGAAAVSTSGEKKGGPQWGPHYMVEKVLRSSRTMSDATVHAVPAATAATFGESDGCRHLVDEACARRLDGDDDDRRHPR